MYKSGPKPAKPTPVQSELPAPPAWLRPEARAVFLEVGKQLADSVGIALVDADLLASYALAVEDHRAAVAALAAVESRYIQGPNGALYQHPAIRDVRQAGAMIARLARILGIGATARKRLGNIRPAPALDPLAEYINFPNS